MSPTPPAGKIRNEIKTQALKDMTSEGIQSTLAIVPKKNIDSIHELSDEINDKEHPQIIARIKSGETLRGTKVS